MSGRNVLRIVMTLDYGEVVKRFLRVNSDSFGVGTRFLNASYEKSREIIPN